MDLDLTPVQRVAHMLGKGYAYGAHYLPHDAAATRTSGKADAQVYTEAGLANVRVLPRTHDIWIGINACLQMFPRFSFRLPACERGLDALANYAYKRSSATGIVVQEPVHNWASHAADALRMIAEAEMAGMLKTGFAAPRPTVVTTGIRDLDWNRRTVVRR
jgi:phage terminase large subunit